MNEPLPPPPQRVYSKYHARAQVAESQISLLQQSAQDRISMIEKQAMEAKLYHELRMEELSKMYQSQIQMLESKLRTRDEELRVAHERLAKQADNERDFLRQSLVNTVTELQETSRAHVKTATTHANQMANFAQGAITVVHQNLRRLLPPQPPKSNPKPKFQTELQLIENIKVLPLPEVNKQQLFLQAKQQQLTDYQQWRNSTEVKEWKDKLKSQITTVASADDALVTIDKQLLGAQAEKPMTPEIQALMKTIQEERDVIVLMKEDLQRKV